MRISIVTPSFNQGRYIERTIRSVLLQGYADLEYIVMDGGSADNTLEVLQKYQDRFAYWTSAPDKGQADAIARGLEHSTGEIMAYLNSDDVLAPGTLHFVDRFFSEHPKVDAIYSHRLSIDEHDRVIWHWLLPVHISYMMKRWDFIPQETCFWRRRLFERAGNIDSSYRFAMDYDLFVRYMKRGKFQRVNRFLAAFRVHPESKTTKEFKTIGMEEFHLIWERHQTKWHPHDYFLQTWFVELASSQGERFGALRKHLPGAFAGLGYDYNDFWGGLLKEPASKQP
ncbi:MAG TPA: glycosyltransferase family 2 protein [Chthoniobacterales bacterium]